MEVKEAHVKFPNLPVPKSSDGNVSALSFHNCLDKFSGCIVLGHQAAKFRYCRC